VYDWYVPGGMKFMSAPPPPAANVRASMREVGTMQKKISVVDQRQGSFRVAPPVLTEGLPNLHPGDMEYARLHHRCHYRFAAGRILPKPYIAAMFSMAYYTPGILELVEAVINPAKTKQSNLVWTLPVPPEFEGRAYKELFAHFIGLGTIPLALLRGVTGPIPYVCAKLPLATTLVEREDALYLLADRPWAEENLGSFFAMAVNGGKLPGASLDRSLRLQPALPEKEGELLSGDSSPL